MFKRTEQQKLMLESVKVLADNQEAITKQLETLTKLLENGNIGKLSYDSTGCSITTTLNKINMIENKYNSIEDYIQKEILYNKDYDKCYNKNADLLEFIETYCNVKDKYDVIDLFNKINAEYEIKKKFYHRRS